ncbi:MAG: ATP-binding cassette domain-containing protein [Actinobacteria bacterium]|uniref:Unannotated protein n=1 Tax=freshwater metagenome TaxID=449393 RepID=A0A6J7EUF1_9ZZZZ|nr:ATP-binding cassette domain-containing protein [Actinomycetota bacterium]MSY26454.1 ATP-binding cassette domain-containing protein [Actinomycetota bacterium]MSZ86093.1 ATP-binding cassette domain-containing protein [Actinomycetota bacterium]MTB13527.1 ATP-binding cassette domain-containing protein [Actinomycetota bacterium]MTB24329.1 ATP-binding cassette domain-containing protein [Actinomycetota bacterium]
MNNMNLPSSAEESSLTDGDSSIIIQNLLMEFEIPGSQGVLRVIDDVSFRVGNGEFVAVVGPSGCGKTTLLRIIAGLLKQTSGEVSVVTESPHTLPRLGFVSQQANLYPWRRVIDNVSFGRELKQWNGKWTAPWKRKKIRDEVMPYLELVGLKDFPRYFPHQISGGMQQRVNLARALAINPEVLLMDEPFGALDAQTRENLQDELQKIALSSDASIIFITHDIREAVYLADRVIVLTPRPGKVRTSVRVPAVRPRAPEYQLTEEFNDLVRLVWHDVHGESGRQ